MSSAHISEKRDGLNKNFGYLSTVSGNMEPKRITVILQLSIGQSIQRLVRIIQMEPNTLNLGQKMYLNR